MWQYRIPAYVTILEVGMARMGGPMKSGYFCCSLVYGEGGGPGISPPPPRIFFNKGLLKLNTVICLFECI